MIYADFVARVRFLFSDTESSNAIYRENLIARPGNVIDGNNKIFYLLNRRIASIVALYDADGVDVPPTDYVLTPLSGRLVFNVPPARPLFIDYSWYKLADEELDQALRLAAASGGFSVDSVADTMADYAVHYAVSYCFTAAASKAADYYTLSASGKQVSKSELYNHYVALATQFGSKAQELRTDYMTSRGTRDIPVGEDSTCDAATPYFPSDGGI
jgi:hypothetical protein